MPESEIHSDIVMDLNAFADEKPGKIAVTVKGFVRKDDLQPFLASVSAKTLRAIPAKRKLT